MAKNQNAPAAAEEATAAVVADQSAPEQPATDSPATAEADAAQPVAQMTLTEFCTRLSTKDKRVELIGAFHHVESKAKRLKDTEANYSVRYQAFLKQPA